jgi:ABC-type multidrug transport system ATPase subunit
MRITVDAVSKTYKTTQILEDVSLDVQPGDILALLGANGAGKSTLMRILGGAVIPDAGTVAFDGEAFRRDDLALRRRLSFLPDLPAAFATMTAIEHVSMALELYGIDPLAVEDAVVQAFADLQVLSLVDTALNQMSRGQMYKVVLIPSLVLKPDLWLLDEPFAAGMDPNGILVLRQALRAAVEAGQTVIYTTQILEVAARFCTRICVLHEGRVMRLGTMAELEQQAGTDDPLTAIFEQLREPTDDLQ